MSGGRTSRKSGSAKIFTTLSAVLAVAIMLLSTFAFAVAPMAADTSYAAAPESKPGSGTHNITYHTNGGTGTDYTVSYNGIASTEYNPLYWAGSFTDTGGHSSTNWAAPSSSGSDSGQTSSNTYTQNISLTSTNNNTRTATITLADTSGNVRITSVTKSGANPGQAQNLNFDDTHITFSYKVARNTTYSLSLIYTLQMTEISETPVKVFAGWATNPSTAMRTNGTYTGTVYLPGDVVPNTVTDLYPVWATCDMFRKSATAVSWTNDKFGNNNTNTATINGSPASTVKIYTIKSTADLTASKTIVYSDGRTAPNMYTTQYEIGADYNAGSTAMPVGSYRSDRAYGHGTELRKITLNGQAKIGGNVIIDNLDLVETSPGSSHGGSVNYGLFTQGHILILGTGITSSSTSMLTAPQIVGSTSNITAPAVSNKSIVSETLDPLTVDLATCIIIHSGWYSNIIGGGGNITIGSSAIPLSTYMVLKGGNVLDTVCGGNTNGGTITSSGGNVSDGPNQGGTFVYVTGMKMRGDIWEENDLGYLGSDAESMKWMSYNLNESTILEGANGSGGSIGGSSHVFLSDRGSVYDVQAGPRGYNVTVTFAFMEISGSAVVKHLACGTVTDGNNSGSRNSVSGVQFNVTGAPYIGAIYGAGYDTWYDAPYPTMTSGTIAINVWGGYFGSIYGGGYRGAIGTDSSDVHIVINFCNGTVYDSIYGGGRGGVNKIMHNSYGNKSDSDATGTKNSTGQSYVYGTTSVNIYGGTVNGNVYGGGESVPRLYDYKPEAYATAGKIAAGAYTAQTNVAQVVGDAAVAVYGGLIRGSVYGAGKGIDVGSQFTQTGTTADGVKYGTSEYFDSCNYVIRSGNAIGKAEWCEATNRTMAQPYSIYNISTDYTTFARVTGSSSVTVEGGTVQGSVYGGGAFGTAGSSSVTVNGGTVLSDVYGGGLGVLGKSSVAGSTAATVTSGSVSGSVYGGCMNGITGASSFAAVSGGSIGGNVFGGGLGAPNTNSVNGSSEADVSGGTVAGAVYGGCSLGVTVGNSTVRVTGGTVSGNVFAGGLGLSEVVSVKGKRYVYINGGTVEGSVYAGSSFGDDMSNPTRPTEMDSNSDAFVIFQTGTVEGSVYGGGYRGTTTGSTYIYIGYSDANAGSGTKSQNGTIYIGNSVYGGGDVGDLAAGERAFVKTIVYGTSSVYVNATNNTFSFTGSFSCAGNSCLTAGDGTMVLEGVVLDNQIESIHRAKDVMLIGCELNMVGRVTGTEDNTRYSFYMVENLKFQSGTTVYIYAPLGEITTFSSMSSPSSYTMSTSPLNRVYICDGTMFEIRRTEAGVSVYGMVTGYTILSIETVEDYYGAFALGSIRSTGGFVIESDGTYITADSTDFITCRCWFIAGVLQTVSSSTLTYTDAPGVQTVDDGGQYLVVPTLSTSTGIRYSGGYFTPSVAGLYSIGEDVGDKIYSVKAGTNTRHNPSAITLSGGNGAFVPNQPNDYFEVILSDDRPTQPLLEVTVSGVNSNFNAYIGYVIIYVQEVVPVTYKDQEGHDVTDYIIQNKIELRIDIYMEGLGTDIGDSSAIIKTVSGAGTAQTILPSRLNDYSVYLTGVATDIETEGEGSGLFVSTVKNNGGNLGWNSPLRTVDVTGGFSGRQIMQTLTGAFQATIEFSVSGFSSDVSQSAEFTFELYDSAGVYVSEFTVTLTISKQDPVNVRFVDVKQGIERNYSFEYGSKITEANCPSTLDSFVGWYEDPTYYNKYNFGTPLTYDLTLYARYMYTVTFDNMNGTTSKMFVELVAGGLTINEPAEPTWEGFVFAGWYKDIDHIIAWDFEEDKVLGDVTLYAKWNGDNFYIRFKYSFDDGQTYNILQDAGGDYTPYIAYGGIFGESIDNATVLLKGLPQYPSNMKFIRWQTEVSGNISVGIYADTEVTIDLLRNCSYEYKDGKRLYDLYAEMAEDAVAVVLDTNTEDLTARIAAPVDFILFQKEGLYRFYGNNATRTGYRLLGWATDPAGTQNYHPLGEEWILTAQQAESMSVLIDGVKTITLYAVWEKIVYIVTIVDPAGGTIDAYYNGQKQNVIYAYYGEEVTLSYTAGDGFAFNKWYINGEGRLSSVSAATTTLTVVGSCAVYVQVKGLEPVTVNVYLNGGTSSSPELLNLYLSPDGNTTYVKFIRRSVEQDGEGKYYGVYNISSKLGTFYISAMDSGTVLDEVGQITVIDGGVQTTVEIISIEGDVTGGSLVSLPRYVNPGAEVIFSLPENYEVDGNLVLVYNGENHTVYGNAFTLPLTMTSGVSVTGALKLVDRTVTYSSAAGFTYKVDDTAIASKTVPHGTALGTLPTVYDSNGYELGSSNSAYRFIGWYYDAQFGSAANPGDSITADVMLYPNIAEKESVQYTVRIYQMGLDGAYPSAPTYSITASGRAGQTTTYTPPVYTGFSLVTASSVYTNFILVEGMVIDLQYQRASKVAMIDLGSGTGTMPGWNIDQDNHATKTVYYGEVIALPALVREGYTHTGWTVDGSPYSATTYTVSTMNGSVLFFPEEFAAAFTINTYTLTLRTQYSAFSNSETLLSLSAQYGQAVNTVAGYEVPQSLTGYTLLGWTDGSAAFDPASAMPASDLDLTASWSINTHTVTFTGDPYVRISGTSGGNSFVSGASLNYGVGVTLTILFNPGYTMSTHTPTDLGSVTYTSRQDYTWTFAVPDDDVVISITSEISKFRIYFVVDGAEDTSLRKNVAEGVTVDLTDIAPYRLGYTFDGWYSATNYLVPVERIEYVSSDWTVYGRTAANRYNVEFNGNGATSGSTAGMQNLVYGTGYNLTANGFAKAGSVFLGWAASASGDALYTDGEVVFNLTAEADATVTLYAVWLDISEYSGIYDGAGHASTVSGTNVTVYYSETPFSSAAYSNGSTAPIQYTDAGTYTVYYYAAGANIAKNGSLSVTIAPAPLSVTVVSRTSGVIYDGTNKTVETEIVGLKGSDAIQSVALQYDGAADARNAGTYSVTVHSVAFSTGKASNYDVAKVGGTLVISPAPLTVTSGSASKTYDGTELTENTASAAPGQLCSGDVLVSWNVTGTITDAGSAENTIENVRIENGNADVTGNYDITLAAGTLTVNRKAASVTVTGIPSGITYDGQAHTTVYTVSGLLGTDVLTATLAYDDNISAGTCTVTIDTVTFTSGKASNYNVEKIGGTIVIGQRAITVTSGSDSKTYDGSALTKHDGMSVTTGSLASGDRLVSGTVTGTITDVGSAANTITAALIRNGSDADVSGNYAVSFAYGTLSVTEADFTNVSVTGYSAKYDGQTHPAATYSAVSVNGQTQTWLFSTDGGESWVSIFNVTDVSDSKNGIMYKVSAPNHNDATGYFNATVLKRTVMLTSGSDSKDYDGTALTCSTVSSVAAGYDGFVGGQGATYTVSGTITNAGDAENVFTYQLNSGTAEGNYTFTAVSGTLTVEKKPLTSLMFSVHSPYNYSGEEITAVYTAADVPEGMSESILRPSDFTAAGTLKATYAGSYDIIFSATGTGNYSGSVSITWAILSDTVPVPQAIQGLVYDGTERVAVEDDEYGRYTVVGGSAVNAGIYTATVTLSDPVNYTWAQPFDGTVRYEIAKGHFSIIANGYTGYYDAHTHSVFDTVEPSIEGVTLYFSTDTADDKVWTTVMPTLTDVGTLIAWVYGTADNYEDSEPVRISSAVYAAVVPVPVATVGLIYDGTEQVAVSVNPEYAECYYVVGGSAINAGDHSAVAKLFDRHNYVWATVPASSDDLQVPYEIEAATFTIEFTPYSGIYDGAWHNSITVDDDKGANIMYSLDSITWDTQIISIRDVNYFQSNGSGPILGYKIYVSAIKENYSNYIDSTIAVISPMPIIAPTPIAGLVYDGTVKTAVAATDDYTVANGSAIEPGIYVATASLRDPINHVWADTMGTDDIEVEYDILSAILDISFRAYSGVYDAKSHVAVSIIEGSGAKIYYSFDGIDWTDTVPSVRDVIDSGTIIIKATKTGYADKIYTAEIRISPARLTVQNIGIDLAVSDSVPKFSFEVTGLLGDDTLVAEDTGSLFGAFYEPGKDQDGNVIVFAKNDLINQNYNILVFNGNDYVEIEKMAVDWDEDRYDRTGEVDRFTLVLSDLTGTAVRLDMDVKKLSGTGDEDRFGGTLNVKDGYDVNNNHHDRRDSLLDQLPTPGNTYNQILIIIIVCLIAAGTYWYFVARKKRKDKQEDKFNKEN